jgi:hypothetical protein
MAITKFGRFHNTLSGPVNYVNLANDTSSSLVTACTYQKHKNIPRTDRIDVIRLLLENADLDFETSDSQAWKMILVLLERSRPSSGFTTDVEPAEWMLKMCQEAIQDYIPPENLFWLLLFCCESTVLTELLLKIHKNVVNTTCEPGGFSVFHSKIAEGFPDSVIPCFEVLARNGADLHLVGSTDSYGAELLPQGSQPQETPTSLALRRSNFFYKWRTLLYTLRVDIQEFIAAELKSSLVLAKQGWTISSLTNLFNTTFVPFEVPRIFCWQCERDVHIIYSLGEEWWQELLTNIRDQKLEQESVHRRSSDASNFSAQSDIFYDATDDEPLQVLEESEASKDTAFLCWKCNMMAAVRGEIEKPAILKRRVP